MAKTKIIILSAVGIIALVGATGLITTYIINYDDGMAKITSVTPFMLTNQKPYQECIDERKTTYTRSGDKYNVIGGVGGGVGTALVVHAVTANPVLLAGGAIAGVFGGQAIERHVKKPKAHTRTVENCTTKYQTEQTQAGYLVSFTYHHVTESRVLANQPLDTKMPITTLEAAPTPQQVIAQNQKPRDEDN